MDDTPTAQRRSQMEAMAGVIAGTVIAVGLGDLVWRHLGVSPRPVELAERLAFAAQWCLIPGLCVLASVLLVSNQRFFTSGIDPIAGADDRTLRVLRWILGNTLEQAFLFVIAVTAFAAVAPQEWLKAVPVAALLFVLGRVLFAVGYLIRPPLHVTGFTLTIFPTVVLYGVAAWLYWFQP
jgi:hypothetical protein